MAGHSPKHRKRRTRQHIIAAQSVNFVERFIIDGGHTAQRVEFDYGYDLLVTTFDEQGYEEPGLVYIQLKSTDSIEAATLGAEITFDIDVRDYDLWIRETMPVILVVFDAQRRRAWWLFTQRYFTENPPRKNLAGAKTLRVRIPLRQRFGHRAVNLMRGWKQEILQRSWGKIGHG